MAVGRFSHLHKRNFKGSFCLWCLLSPNEKWKLFSLKKEERSYFLLWQSLPLPTCHHPWVYWPEMTAARSEQQRLFPPRACVLSLQWKYNEGVRGMLILYIWTVLSSRKVGAKFPGFLGGLRKAVTQHTAWLSADGNDDRWDLGQRSRECALARAFALIVHFQRSCSVRPVEAVCRSFSRCWCVGLFAMRY